MTRSKLIQVFQLMTTIVVVVCFAFVAGCKKGNEQVIPSQEAQTALSELNSWDREELKLAEGPNASDRKPSGETLGWIHSHKQNLAEMGYDVQWDPNSQAYEMKLIIEGK